MHNRQGVTVHNAAVPSTILTLKPDANTHGRFPTTMTNPYNAQKCAASVVGKRKKENDPNQVAYPIMLDASFSSPCSSLSAARSAAARRPRHILAMPPRFRGRCKEKHGNEPLIIRRKKKKKRFPHEQMEQNIICILLIPCIASLRLPAFALAGQGCPRGPQQQPNGGARSRMR